ELWNCQNVESATAFWKKWFHWASHSRLKPVIAAAQTLKKHLHNILTFFRHRITTAVSEGLNSKIRTIQQMASGFRNEENFRTAIYFHWRRLALYPATH